MEIVGGFMVMMSIIGFFLAVVWLIMPFVVFAIKGKQDRSLEVLEAIEKRLAVIESRIQQAETARNKVDETGNNGTSTGTLDDPSVSSSNEHRIENTVTLTESAADKNGSEASPAA